MRITEVTRHVIMDKILLSQRPFHGSMDLLGFLGRIWNLQSMPSTDRRFTDAAGDIYQHMVNNSDWDESELLCGRLGLLGADDAVFLKFLEAYLHPLAVPDKEEAARLADELNEQLKEDGYRLKVTSYISGRPVYSAVEITGAGDETECRDVYEIVLSFAGEDRAYVEQVASFLREHDVRCFYDKYEEATLWGKDLAEHLDKVYRSARYCVMFLSKSYADKMWTSHERRSALARAVEEKGEYILPARFDDTEVPGIRHTLGYVDLRAKSPEELGAMILQKLGRRPREMA